MDGHNDEPVEGGPTDAASRAPDAHAEIAPEITPSHIGLSRRDFATRIGAGGVAAVGLAIAAPNIRTIRFATKAAVGSPPPTTGSTTTTTVGTGQQSGGGGSISVSDSTPCVGDTIHVHASGFVPHTAVRILLDGETLGVVTADSHGSIDVTIKLHHSQTGSHTIRVVGIQKGGRTLTLSKSLHIKSEEECNSHSEGTTVPGSTALTTPTTTVTPVTAGRVGGGLGPNGGGSQQIGNESALAFTGTDAIDLALIGAAATVGGRLLYGLARPRDDEEDE